MNAAAILALLQWIPTIISGAKNIAEAAQGVYKYIASLFKAGMIDKATQDMLNAKVDEICLAFIKGELPPSFTVEPDPVMPPPAPAP